MAANCLRMTAGTSPAVRSASRFDNDRQLRQKNASRQASSCFSASYALIMLDLASGLPGLSATRPATQYGRLELRSLGQGHKWGSHITEVPRFERGFQRDNAGVMLP